MNRRDILLKIAYPLLGAAIFVGIWWIAAACVGVEIILPAPNVVFGRFFGLFADGKFWLSLGYSVGRTLPLRYPLFLRSRLRFRQSFRRRLQAFCDRS